MAGKKGRFINATTTKKVEGISFFIHIHNNEN
jgi:hypothetical protein